MIEGPGIFLRRAQDLDTTRLVKAGIRWVAVALTYAGRPIKGMEAACKAVLDAGLVLVTWDWFPDLASDPDESVALAARLGAAEHWTNIEAAANGRPREARAYADRLIATGTRHGIRVGLCSFGRPPKRFPLADFHKAGITRGVFQAYDRYGEKDPTYPDRCRKAWAGWDLITGVGAFVDADGTGPDPARWRTPAEIRAHLALFSEKEKAWIAWPPNGKPKLDVLRAIARPNDLA